MDSPSPDDVNKVNQLWQWAMAGVAAGAAWLWNSTMGRIKALESGKLDKDDFKVFMEGAEQSRKETRENLISLFAEQKKTGETLARIEGKLDR